MDILKVLSRGTIRQSKRQGNFNLNSANIPSGSRPNPQLFHDDVGGHTDKKRKREEPAQESIDEDVSDLDFFAPKISTKVARTAKGPKPRKATEPPTLPEVKLLDEDECRQILRSHRLKATLIPTRKERASKVRKSRKTKAAVKVDAGSDKKQLHPQPLVSFDALRSYGISRRLAENLERFQFRIPTEIQMASLPLLIKPEVALQSSSGTDGLEHAEGGVDFMAIAPTGSGKTLSFLIPAINGIMERRAEERGDKQHKLSSVVVVPTRELAKQIANEGKKLCIGTGVRVVAMRKGMEVMVTNGATDDVLFESEDESADEDEEQSQHSSGAAEEAGRMSTTPITKADILVTTPMLLLNLLSDGLSGTKRTLPTVNNLVLDEADALLDDLFRDQTLAIWAACTSPVLQVTFWSATMPSNIETLVTEQIKSRADLLMTVSRPLVRLVVGLKDTAVVSVTHKLVYTATEQGKLLALRQLLHPTAGADSGSALRPPFLVFTQTIDRANALYRELKYEIPLQAGGSSRIAVLHSALSDSVRSNIMRRFREGVIWVLITTDILSRGLDFSGVNGVVNFDLPQSAASFIHRSGRTGRAGREGGVAVTFYSQDDIGFVKSVANVIALSEKQAGRKSGGDQETGIQKWLLDALPNVGKADRKKLKERGVESRRSGGKAKITSKSGWDRRKEHNKMEAIKASKKRKTEQQDEDGTDSEWAGLND